MVMKLDDGIRETARVLDQIPDDAKSRLFGAMRPMEVSGGTTFIRQGDEGDCLYLIESGTCVVSVNADGASYSVAVRGPGELVGEMALITGEPRNADVTAARNAVLWRLDRRRFEEICAAYPQITILLTEIMTSRLANAKHTAARTIGDYIITDVVGNGSTSIVYRGRREGTSVLVAIKMLKHDRAMDSRFLEAFRDEARVLADLRHQNIVGIYDIRFLYRTVFIIMEYLDGDSLETILKNPTRLHPDVASRILIDICSGLAYAHSKGVVHGDIKPSNIFIPEGDVAKIIDFGVSCRVGTEAGAFFGTPRYASPEQVVGLPLTDRSDIYSLGLVAYRMVTGREAFPSTDPGALMMKQLYQEVPDPRLSNPDVPEGLRHFILKATRRVQAERYSSIVQGVTDLGA